MKNQFSAVVRYTKQNDNGTFKRVSETYLFTAESFTDAEARVFEEVGSFIGGEFVVSRIERKQFEDVIFGPVQEELFFECRVGIVSNDPDSMTEKKVKMNFLVNAASVEDASKKVSSICSEVLREFEVEKVTISKIIEVFINN